MASIEPARKTRKITEMFGLSPTAPSGSAASAVAATSAPAGGDKEMKPVLTSFFKVLGKADSEAKPISMKSFRKIFAKVFGWVIPETDGTCGQVIREVFPESEDAEGGGVAISKPRTGTLFHGLTIRDSPTPNVKQPSHKFHQDWIRICNALKSPCNESIKWGSVLKAICDGDSASVAKAVKGSNTYAYPPFVVRYTDTKVHILVEHACGTMAEPVVSMSSVQVTVSRSVGADSVPPSGTYTASVKLSRLLDCNPPVIWNSQAHCYTLTLHLLGSNQHAQVVRTQIVESLDIFSQVPTTENEDAHADADALTSPSSRQSASVLSFADMGVSPGISMGSTD